MQLDQLLKGLAPLPPGAAGVRITSITADSRKVVPGALFVAIPGTKADGAGFAVDAARRGAVAVVLSEAAAEPEGLSIPVLRVADPRQALSRLAARFFGRQPEVAVAVTGTSGKTSVAEFTRQIFAACGRKAASVGTIGIVKSDGAVYGSLTTPDPVTLQAILKDLADEGVTHLAFEASSHGLDQHRLDGVRLTAAAFTNLGRDHMDYHPTVEHYFEAKMRLLTDLLPPGATAVVNRDGDRSADAAEAAEAAGRKVMTVGRGATGIALVTHAMEQFTQRLTLEHAGLRYDVRLPLVGFYQVENALVAAGLAIAAGETPQTVFAALSSLQGVKGRLEIVGEAKGGLAIVDYAHKPEALTAALEACRPFVTGKLICVFGCGGDRDKGKRPIMGEIASRLADVVIVTDDNPRSENPAVIRSEVLTGAPGALDIGDRAEAIRTAIRMMEKGDVVLVAGKGHETGQIVGDTVVPFSDQDEIAEAMKPFAALWTFDALVAAAGGIADGAPGATITGFSIDTRALQPGEVFVALKDVRDGHEFVTKAFDVGAAAALVSKSYERKPGDGALIRVDDVLSALECIGRAARGRLAPDARVVAVTGSAGKTTTKEMLRACCAALAPGHVHASDKSFNNHWGVPLTLARMPADTRFAIFEIGMNHAGEITPLVGMVRPHAALVTTVEAVHLAHFGSVAEIAEAKAEIFNGLMPGGAAIIPSDNPHTPLLEARARAKGARVLTCGESEGASVRLVAADLLPSGSRVTISLAGAPPVSFGLGLSGRHNVLNATEVAGALSALGLPASVLATALAALEGLRPPPGRGTQDWLIEPGHSGRRLLLMDESYNANPASMKAALGNLKLVADWSGGPLKGRRIAVLGDMLELGADAPQLHAGLAAALAEAGVDLLFAAGPNMKHLYDAVPEGRRAQWGPDSKSIEAALLNAVRPGDAVIVKGSNGSRMGVLVEALRRRYSGTASA